MILVYIVGLLIGLYYGYTVIPEIKQSFEKYVARLVQEYSR